VIDDARPGFPAGPAHPSSSVMLIPAAFAQDTVESLFAEMGAEQPWIYRFLLAGAIGALASLPLINVDLAVRAPASSEAATNASNCVPRCPARLCGCWRRNEPVRAGQALLVISSADVDERLAHNRALQRGTCRPDRDLQQVTSWATELRSGG